MHREEGEPILNNENEAVEMLTIIGALKKKTTLLKKKI